MTRAQAEAAGMVIKDSQGRPHPQYKTTFSLIGVNARTWDIYKNRAFKGFYDGKLRAEIDDSASRLKNEKERGNHLSENEIRDIVNDIILSAFDSAYKLNTKSISQKIKHIQSFLDYMAWGAYLNENAVSAYLKSHKRFDKDSVGDFIFSQKPYSLGRVIKNAWTLEQYFDAPELYAAYPQLRNVFVYETDLGVGTTNGLSGGNVIEINNNEKHPSFNKKETILHEIQHLIQEIEDFATGSNKRIAYRDFQTAYSRAKRRIKEAGLTRNGNLPQGKIRKGGVSGLTREQTEARDKYLALKKIDDAFGYHPGILMRFLNFIQGKQIHELINVYPFYKISAGEAEARNVQRRANMSEIERKEKPFNTTLDVSLDEAIITFKNFPSEHGTSVPTSSASSFALTPLTPEARKSFSVARRSQQFHSILVTAKREASRYSSTYRNASHNAKQAIVESARLSGILQGIAKRIPTAFRPKGLTERIRIHNTLARMLHDGKLSRSSKLNKAFMEALREELATTGKTAKAEIEARLQRALNNPADPVRKKVEERLRKELYSKAARQHLDAINKLSTDPSLAPKKRAYERMAESGFIPESMLEEVYEAILDTVAEEAQQKDPENKLTKDGRRKLENELLRKHAKAYAKAQLRDIAFLSEMEKRYRTEEKQNLIHGFARVQADGRIAADSTLPPAAQSSLAHAVEEELAAALPEAIAKDLNTTLPEINKELMQEIMSRHIGQELHTVLTVIVDEVADSIDRAYKAHYLGRLQRALDTLKPSKSKSHLAPVKLSHEQYAYIAKLVEYTRLTLPQLEEKQTALQARITELGEKEGESEALMEAQLQYAELTTFGALLQRPADDVVNAVEKFFDIISTGKAEWREKLEAQAARIRSAQNAIKAGVGKVDKDAIAEKERQAASFLGSLKLGLSLKNFFSIPQFLDWLTLIPGMKGMAQSWRTAHARAVQVIRRLELDDIAAEKAFWKSIGIETDLQQATFFESALKRTSTGIYTANKIERRTINIDSQTAQEWLDLTPEQREERRSKLREQGAKPETIVEEEAIPAIAEQLESGNNKKIRLSYKRELPGTSYELKADKMILLNLVLMAERPAYTEHMAEVGFDRATIARIKRYLGKDIRAYGNFMRQYLQRTGMREVYAERTGIKIPDDDFYWPGNFDQSNRLDDAASALEQSLALQGRYGFLKELKEHNLDPTLIMGAHQVFRTALSQHRHYIHLGQLSQDLRRLVHDKDTAAALKTYMGIAGFNSFKAHLDTLDGMPAAQANVTRWLNRIVSVALAARATILLPANIGTLIKNLSSVINASRGSNMTLAQELRQILKDRFTTEDKLGISIKELWNSDLIQTRFRNISHYEAIRSLGSNGKFSKTSIITRGLFRGIEAFDAAGNVLGAQALYNFTYQQEKQANATREANGEQPLTEEQIHQVCRQTVQIMLDIAAQPLSPSQSSALSARDRSALTRSLVFMGSEGINKLANAELAAIHKGADAGFISRLLARAQYLAPYSTFEQMVVMAIALATGSAPTDDDEEWKWWVGNAIAAATGAGVLQSYPLIGDTLSELTRAITGSKSFMPTGMMAELTGTDLNSLIKIGKDTAVLTKAITDSITGTTDKKSKSAAELTWIILQNLRRIATIAAPFSGYSRIGTTLGDTLTATNAIGNLCRYPAQAWKNAEAAEKKASKRATTRRRGVAPKRKGITPTRQK